MLGGKHQEITLEDFLKIFMHGLLGRALREALIKIKRMTEKNEDLSLLFQISSTRRQEMMNIFEPSKAKKKRAVEILKAVNQFKTEISEQEQQASAHTDLKHKYGEIINKSKVIHKLRAKERCKQFGYDIDEI